MNNRIFLLSLFGVVISFIGGFLLANALNRTDLEKLRGENARLRQIQTETEKNDLSDEEIRAKIAETEKNPDDFEAHKNLGTALFQYSTVKQTSKYLPDSIKLLRRAAEINPKDFNIQAALGNVHFMLGQMNRDTEALKKAREFYSEALKIKPEDEQVLTDAALTYFLSEPPEFEKSISELEKVLKINPKNERVLDGLARIYLTQGKTKEASEIVNRLKEINPQSRSLAELEAKINQ